MDEPNVSPGPSEDGSGQRVLQRFGDVVDRIEARFGPNGILGLALIDASGFSGIEREYGYQALRDSMNNLGALASELVSDHLGIDDHTRSTDQGRITVGGSRLLAGGSIIL